MASSLFGSQNAAPNNDIMKRFSEFKQFMQGQNPQEIVRGLLQSGRMTKAEYEQLKAAAKQF